MQEKAAKKAQEKRDEEIAGKLYDDMRDALILAGPGVVLPSQDYALNRRNRQEAERKKREEDERRRRELVECKRLKEEERRKRTEGDERRRRKEAEQEKRRKEAEERKKREEAARRKRAEEERIRKVYSSSPPRDITGTAGSRVMLLLGTTGSDFVLFCDEDDGETECQSPYWSTGTGSLPHTLAHQLNKCAAEGRYVTTVNFGPSGEWYMSGKKRDGTGATSWWEGVGAVASEQIKVRAKAHHPLQVFFGDTNKVLLISGKNGFWASGVDCDLSARLDRINKLNASILMVRQYSDGGYFIKDSEGTEWKGLGTHLANEIKNGGTDSILDVVCARDGSWVVLRPDRYTASGGVSRELTTRLAQFYVTQKGRAQQRVNAISKFHAEKRRAIDRIESEAAARKRATRKQAAVRKGGKHMDHLRQHH
jgi:hypothetical protein